MKPAERKELTVQVMLKPNCGLENTRASLVMRRIMPLCDTASCHPSTIKSDRSTIAFLRDHGLFINFSSPAPEQVLLTIEKSFFVDRCIIVSDQDAIPAYRKTAIEADGTEGPAFAPSSAFASENAPDGRENELTNLLARFEEVHRKLQGHAESLPQDHTLSNIAFSHAQVVDELRTAVARSRVEPFERIVPSLRTLIADYSQRFGVLVDLDIADSHIALDRSVLAPMKEIIKRVMRSCIRDGIEQPEHRIAAGKPPRATLRLRLENDSSEVVCRIEHDGRLFNPRSIGLQAVKRGLLTRPLEAYTEEELGALLLAPGFITASENAVSNMFSQFNEIGYLLQRVGGHGEVRNTDHGTLEIALHVPVPFTIMEVALLRTGSTPFVLPAQQIARFEAYRAERIETGYDDALEPRLESRPTARSAFYAGEDGKHSKLLNGPDSNSPLKAERPLFVLFSETAGERHCLAVDAVDGYERVSISQLPPLIDHGPMRKAGCFGYALLKDGAPRAAVSIRHLLNAVLKEEGGAHE